MPKLTTPQLEKSINEYVSKYYPTYVIENFLHEDEIAKALIVSEEGEELTLEFKIDSEGVKLVAMKLIKRAKADRVSVGDSANVQTAIPVDSLFVVSSGFKKSDIVKSGIVSYKLEGAGYRITLEFYIRDLLAEVGTVQSYEEFVAGLSPEQDDSWDAYYDTHRQQYEEDEDFAYDALPETLEDVDLSTTSATVPVDGDYVAFLELW